MLVLSDDAWKRLKSGRRVSISINEALHGHDFSAVSLCDNRRLMCTTMKRSLN